MSKSMAFGVAFAMAIPMANFGDKPPLPALLVSPCINQKTEQVVASRKSQFAIRNPCFDLIWYSLAGRGVLAREVQSLSK